MKGGRLLAEIFDKRGYTVYPAPAALQKDIPVPSFITAIQLGSSEKMQAFCRAVQSKSPVGSYVLPVPGALPSPQQFPFLFLRSVCWI